MKQPVHFSFVGSPLFAVPPDHLSLVGRLLVLPLSPGLVLFHLQNGVNKELSLQVQDLGGTLRALHVARCTVGVASYLL